jgi:hypothetical protein
MSNTELKEQNSDFTISDRLSTQLQYEIKIKELTEKIFTLEAELKKYKTGIQITPVQEINGFYATIEINGKVKTVPVSQDDIMNYIQKESFPTQALCNDIANFLIGPFKEVVISEIRDDVAAFVNNKMSLNKGSSL